MKTAREILIEQYSEKVVVTGIQYADSVGWDDEDERGALALARILYSDDQLKDAPKAPWEPCCYDDGE